MGTRRKRCRRAGCQELPFVGGLCRVHGTDDAREEVLRSRAVQVLHHGLSADAPPFKPEFADELRRVGPWWRRACDVANTVRVHKKLPLDEAEYAVEWCISLAKAILQANDQAIAGHTHFPELEAVRSWVWERFENLERGYGSNGHARDAQQTPAMTNAREGTSSPDPGAHDRQVLEVACSILRQLGTERAGAVSGEGESAALIRQRDLQGLADRLLWNLTLPGLPPIGMISGLDLGLLESLLEDQDQPRTHKQALRALLDLLERRGWG